MRKHLEITSAALALALLAFLPSGVALADTSPLVNRVIVNQALQQQMQNQLNTQQIQLQSQQDITRASLQTELQQQSLQLQYLLLQQQLELLRIERRAHMHVHSPGSHRSRTH